MHKELNVLGNQLIGMQIGGNSVRYDVVHFAGSALAFEQMALMIRESGAGGGLRMNEIKWLLNVVVDVIVQFDRDERGRFISEVFYEPRRQRLGRWDETGPVAG